MSNQTRHLLKELSLRAVARLSRGPVRFNQLERDIEAPTSFALSGALKKLARDGLILRTVRKVDPPAHVVYSLTPLGASLAESATALIGWLDQNEPQVEAARQVAKLRNDVGDEAVAEN